MSTLQETLNHRRVVDSPSAGGCHSAEDSVPALLLHTGTNERWILPWSHFVSAQFKGDGDREQLTLLFTNHEVEVQGSRLALLLPAIARFHLDSLCSMPTKYEPLGDSLEPFIERLSVRQLVLPPVVEAASSG